MVKDGPNLLLPLQYYKENDQWELIGKPKIDLVPKIPQRYPNSSEIVVTISMQRRPEFYNVALVFPFGIIYLVSTLTFLIPVESGEKISFSVTILLAQMIFYGTLLSILPASSLHVANAFPQMVFVFAHLSLNCLASVIGTLFREGEQACFFQKIVGGSKIFIAEKLKSDLFSRSTFFSLLLLSSKGWLSAGNLTIFFKLNYFKWIVFQQIKFVFQKKSLRFNHWTGLNQIL